LGAKRIPSLERDRAGKFLDPRLERIRDPGKKPPALARNRPRPGGEGVGRGFHGACNVLGAAAWNLGDWAPVRWILDLEYLARSAVDPLPTDQHVTFAKSCFVSAHFLDSRHTHLHRSNPHDRTLKTTSCSRVIGHLHSEIVVRSHFAD
jgi:hypothetical protein